LLSQNRRTAGKATEGGRPGSWGKRSGEWVSGRARAKDRRVKVRFACAVVGALAAVSLWSARAGAQSWTAPVLGPAQVGSLAGYQVAWTTLVDGDKTVSVSSMLAMRWRTGQKVVASFRDSQDEPASEYVMTRQNDGSLTLDNAAHVDKTGTLLGQVIATFDELAGVVADEPGDAKAWTKSLAIAVAPPDATATPEPAPQIALSATRATRDDGFTVTASGSSTQDVAATPAPAAMRLLSRVMRQKPGQATTTCTLEGRFTASGVLTYATLETKTTTVVGKKTSTVDTTWHITRVS
jgi:hypothetical protein